MLEPNISVESFLHQPVEALTSFLQLLDLAVLGLPMDRGFDIPLDKIFV